MSPNPQFHENFAWSHLLKKYYMENFILCAKYVFSLTFYKKTYPGPSLWFILFLESYKPTEKVQTLTCRMQRAFLQVY